ncbi:MAG: thermonuclease family protein [Rhodospirillaceae bacterium]|nr:thermonuclease family protein [Rhodospirillales bacterium]
MMRPVTIALVVAALMAPAVPADAKGQRLETLSGDALVIDGDTIMLSLTKIRMLGIDTPEDEQTCRRGGIEWACGIEASAALTDLVKDKRVTCDLNGRHSYGRPLGRCRIGATDIGAWMVSQGWAVVDPRFEKTYLPQQAEAKAAKRGLWSGTFQMPCEFRGSC